MKILEIIPLDTFFFRDGKPFNMGEESEAEGVFPPYPSTVYGAIRSIGISQKGIASEFAGNSSEVIDKEVGGPQKKGDFSLKGLFLGDQDLKEIYFPLPLSIQVTENSSEKRDLITKQLNLVEPRFLRKNLIIDGEPIKLPYILSAESESDSSGGKKWRSGAGSWCTVKSIKAFLNGIYDVEAISASHFISEEPKTGIARSLQTGTVIEGCLYQMNMLRMKSTGNSFVTLIDNIDISINGSLKMGGEGKTFYYRVNDYDTSSLTELFKPGNITENRILLYLATPALFSKGWLPGACKNENGDIVYQGNGFRMKLLSAATGKPHHIGGWDIAGNKPKPTRKAIPAGSVYFFELMDNCDISKAQEELHGKNISDFLSEEGYGLCFTGTYQIGNKGE